MNGLKRIPEVDPMFEVGQVLYGKYEVKDFRFDFNRNYYGYDIIDQSDNFIIYVLETTLTTEKKLQRSFEKKRETVANYEAGIDKMIKDNPDTAYSGLANVSKVKLYHMFTLLLKRKDNTPEKVYIQYKCCKKRIETTLTKNVTKNIISIYSHPKNTGFVTGELNEARAYDTLKNNKLPTYTDVNGNFVDLVKQFRHEGVVMIHYLFKFKLPGESGWKIYSGKMRPVAGREDTVHHCVLKAMRQIMYYLGGGVDAPKNHKEHFEEYPENLQRYWLASGKIGEGNGLKKETELRRELKKSEQFGEHKYEWVNIAD